MEVRYLRDRVDADLADRMVFVGGPRQVGKTTLVLSLLENDQSESSSGYLNWDVLADREDILAGRIPSGQPRIVFDEVHKYAAWRNLMKGLYDKNKTSVSFIVTGSARLDYYRKGGDSLQGRYHYYRLHPFTVMELGGASDSVMQLLRFGGFPEPCLRGNERFQHVREVSLLDLLLTHLPACVGSPLSVNSLSKLVQVAYESVERWLTIFERLYVCYRIPPFGAERIRAVRKRRSCISGTGLV